MIENENFKKENWSGSLAAHQHFTQVVFESCDLSNCNFSHTHFSQCKFIGCNLSLTKFAGCRLQGVEFSGCKLVGVDFSRCDALFLAIGFDTCVLDMANFWNLN